VIWRRAAVFVDNILKGVKPADLPVGQPTKVHPGHQHEDREGIGLRIPQALLQRADDVIQ